MLKITSKTFVKLAAASAITASFSTAVHADQGFYIGFNVANGTFSHTLERNTGSNQNPSITTRVAESDIAIGVRAGYDFYLTDSFFLGVEGFYDEQNIQTRNLNNLLQTDLELNNTYGVRLKAGVDVNDRFSVYASLGSTALDFDINNSYPFAPPVRSGSADENEISFGFGASYALTDHWALTADFNQVNDVNFSPLPEVAVPGKINPNEVDYASLSVGVNYRF